MSHTGAAVAALFAVVYLGVACGGTTGADVVACGRDAGASGSSPSPAPTTNADRDAAASDAPTASTGTSSSAPAASGTSGTPAPSSPPAGTGGGAFCTPGAACGGLWTCTDPCYTKVDDGTRCCTISCDCSGDPNGPTARFECTSHC